MTRTEAFLLCVLVALILWGGHAALFWDESETISATVSRHAHRWPMWGVLAGVFIAHWFWRWESAPTQSDLRRLTEEVRRLERERLEVRR